MIRRSTTLVRSNGLKNDSFFDPKTDPNIVYAVRKLINVKIKNNAISPLLYDLRMSKMYQKYKINLS